MTAEEIKLLEKKEQNGDFHKAILAHVKRLVRLSRSEMSSYYGMWDKQDTVFRGEIAPDFEDKKQAAKGNPTKMVVPNGYAQIMTFVSFMFLMYKQNPRFYTLNATGDEDAGRKREDSETLLERDTRYNSWDNLVFQALLDTGKFGLCVLEDEWTKQTQQAWVVPEPQQVVAEGGSTIEMPGVGAFEEFVKFEGNLVRNVSPYRFFPDTRLPLSQFQQGEFCASEEEYSMGELRQLEKDGMVAGVDHIEPLPRNMIEARGADTRWSLREQGSKKAERFDANNDSAICLVTKVQVRLVPSKFKVKGEKAMGPQDFPILYDVWYANDNRIIRCEPNKNWHGEFRWSIGQFTPDMHHTVNMGLSELISELQSVISWYINSHITSVRRVIANRLIVDPKIIDTKTLDGEGDVYVRKGMSVPLERAVGQLRVQDVTGGHMADADILDKVMQAVTGVNGNAMGQYNSGRRSAQESRVVTAGAAGRMKMHGHLLWESLFGRTGKHMHSNLRQSLSVETFAMVVGRYFGAIDEMQDLVMRYTTYRGTPAEVICGGDYFLFDSTLASEKGFIAQSLQELLSALMSNPMLPMQWDISVKAIVEEIQRLRGAGNLGQFSLSKRVQAGLEPAPMPMALPEAKPAAAV